MVRAEFTRKKQEDTEKAEVTNVTSLGNLVYYVSWSFELWAHIFPSLPFAERHIQRLVFLAFTSFPITTLAKLWLSCTPSPSIAAHACYPLRCTQFRVRALPTLLLPHLLDFLQAGKDRPCAPSPSALQSSLPWDPAKLKSALLDLLTIYWILHNS